ncbi:hypothetical protein KDN32_05390 [Nocardioides sp. J2M5]|nr:hypothetical protein [Nocardioides palaemonis]MBS2937172.1 hypothetical protein [Nocardioides palaemonis]
MSGTTRIITVTPEQKAKALRDAVRNSKVKFVRATSTRGSAAQGPKSA